MSNSVCLHVFHLPFSHYNRLRRQYSSFCPIIYGTAFLLVHTFTDEKMSNTRYRPYFVTFITTHDKIDNFRVHKVPMKSTYQIFLFFYFLQCCLVSFDFGSWFFALFAISHERQQPLGFIKWYPVIFIFSRFNILCVSITKQHHTHTLMQPNANDTICDMWVV